MKKVNLGQFSTDGSLIVTDPCYKLNSPGQKKKLKVKPGVYSASVIYGGLKKPLFPWDAVPGNFRVARLMIEHSENNKNLSYTKAKCMIDVDSGQAGFFNLNYYNKESKSDVDLIGEQYSFFRDNLTTSILELKRSMQALKKRDKNEFYNRMMAKCFNGSNTKTMEYFERQVESAEHSISESKKILKTRKYPSYMTLKTSKDFYEIICDHTHRENRAGVCDYGAVASSGIGDGGYDLYIAKNTKGKIVGCYLEFLTFDSIK